MEIDILINYTEQDNQSIEGNPGWVTSFEKFLKTILEQVLGTNPTIVAKADTDSLTKSELKNTGILISIVSNQMVKSGPCLDAIEEFCATKKTCPGLLKVMKEAVPYENQPQRLAQLIGYDLYNAENQTEKEAFYDFFGPEAEHIYWMKLVDLAYDVFELIQNSTADKSDVKPLFERKTIYLATTGNDLTIQRNIIRRELQRHGFKVLPDHNLPNTVEELTKEIESSLSKAVFSIHLLGNSYGEIPENSERSVVDLQNKLASKATSASGGKMPRLIWIKPDQSKSSEKQKAFLENLQRDVAALEGAEVLQTPLEDFKNIVREEIFTNQEFGEGKKEDFIVDDKKLNAYLIFDKVDKKATTPIIKTLVKAGINVIEPDFDKSLLEIRKGHLEKLKQLDFAIVFKENVNTNWVRMKLLDLLKAPGLGRTKPIVGKAIVGGKNIELNKEDFDEYEVELIQTENGEGFNEKAILEFIKGLNKAM